MFGKKKRKITSFEDITNALAECDRIVQEFQEKPVDPAYGHIMNIYLERTMKKKTCSENTNISIPNLFFVTRDDGAFGKLDLLDEAALYWCEDHMGEIGLFVVDTINFWELKEGKITVKEIINEYDGYILKEIQKPFVLSICPWAGKDLRRRDIEQVIRMVMEEIESYKENLLFIESRGPYKRRYRLKPRGFKLIDLDKISITESDNT